ncbi:MAG: aspartate 1-decarboxylase [Candidatus Muirbacterium halophilum]|nr:aspartate 1-decarboxylase [Candidatus Muirbacterium halophilum]MCK9475403.1 aspartate 1-decarboxylase [Candidatus Muirbacterium halophilum]
MRTMLNAKIHRATITECDLHYEGSLSIDLDLLKAADILPNEQVHVLNCNNGARFTTYAIAAKPGSGKIGLNGAAARLGENGDIVIIVTYKSVKSEDLLRHKPKIVLLDEKNSIKQ